MTPKKMFIGGQWLAARDERTLAVVAPADGETFARIARGGAHEIDLAVKAARSRARQRRLGPAQRHRARPHHGQDRPGHPRPPRRAVEARSARHRQADDHRAQRHHGAGALLRVLRQRGRQGARRGDPVPERPPGHAAARAAGRDRAHHSVELPGADARPLGRAGAGDGQRGGVEAGRRHEPVGPAGGRDRRGLRAARGRAQRRHRHGRGSRCGAGRPPWHRLRHLHRQQRGRHAGAAGRREERGEVRARTRRQEPADRVRRRRPGPRAADHRARDRAERGADLHRRQPVAAATFDLRAFHRASWPRPLRRRASARPRWTWIAAR